MKADIFVLSVSTSLSAINRCLARGFSQMPSVWFRTFPSMPNFLRFYFLSCMHTVLNSVTCFFYKRAGENLRDNVIVLKLDCWANCTTVYFYHNYQTIHVNCILYKIYFIRRGKSMWVRADQQEIVLLSTNGVYGANNHNYSGGHTGGVKLHLLPPL